MPLAIFQGTITVPMFDTGITVTQNPTCELNCGTGDQAWVGNYSDIYAQSQGEAFQGVNLQSAKVIAMYPGLAAQLTIGNGTTNVSATQFTANPGIMARNNYVNNSMYSTGNNTASTSSVFPIEVPFAGTSKSIFDAPSSAPNILYVGGLRTNYSGAFVVSGVQVVNQLGIPDVSRANITVTNGGQVLGNLPAIACAYRIPVSGTFFQYVGEPLGVGALNFSPTTFFQNTTYNFDTWWNIPAPEARTNYLWSIVTGGVMNAYVQYVQADLDIGAQSFQVEAQLVRDQVIYDNAALNGLTGGVSCIYMPCANGVLYGVNLSGAYQDFYVSKDGTKYWSISYVAMGAKLQNAGFYGESIPAIMQDAQARSRWIDAEGIMWYVGANVTNGVTTFVANSFGFNIPFNPIVLPYVPPISFPCWSACLGRVGGGPGQVNPSVQNTSAVEH